MNDVPERRQARPAKDHRTILTRVGIALIVVGLLDIAAMIYVVSRGQGYSSSLCIFAVIAGIFLLRGSLVAARLVTWFATFLLAGAISSLVVLFPVLKPVGLWATELRPHLAYLLISLVIGIALMAFLFWVYKRLRSVPVVEAISAAGQSASAPKLAFALGPAIAVLLAGIMHITASGDAGAKAMALAKERLGDSYQYHVTAMHWYGKDVRATVIAYNKHEIKTVEVEWRQ